MENGTVLGGFAQKMKAYICVNMFQLPTYTLAMLAFWLLPQILFRQLL